MADGLTAGADTLQRIAGTLGVPVEHLYEGTEPHHLWAARECMRLWDRLTTKTGRDAALDALRKILDDECAQSTLG